MVSNSAVRAKRAEKDFMARMKNFFGGEIKGCKELKFSKKAEERVDRYAIWVLKKIYGNTAN